MGASFGRGVACRVRGHNSKEPRAVLGNHGEFSSYPFNFNVNTVCRYRRQKKPTLVYEKK